MRELEGKLSPFIFFVVVFYKEGDNSNVVAFFSIFDKKKSDNSNVIAFFSMFEEDDSNVPSYSSMVVLLQTRCRLFVFFFLLEKKMTSMVIVFFYGLVSQRRQR